MAAPQTFRRTGKPSHPPLGIATPVCALVRNDPENTVSARSAATWQPRPLPLCGNGVQYRQKPCARRRTFPQGKGKGAQNLRSLRGRKAVATP